MFERFTRTAREAVTGAVAKAEAAHAPEVTEEHLLLSLLDLGALEALTVDEPALHAALEASRRTGMTRADREALADLGIDVDAIVARVEHTHGPGALAAHPPTRTRTRLHLPMSTGAKKVLEGSLRAALARRDRHIGPEHLLLSLTTHPNPATDALESQGITTTTIETAFPDGAAT
ncbi:Clp protease N-terminal domain-containing protein [Streptomyces sp. BI20]|uniref:Clp protease N-terminal domain-containing protein n=1 Tax=Streptomyces sp. BI20 TaxID=3403460 RepID=UPI003C7915B7